MTQPRSNRHFATTRLVRARADGSRRTRTTSWSTTFRSAYRVWGQRGKPGIAFVHGSNAHLEWWRFVAPFLADQFRVVALDLSGNGDSGWRDRYTGRNFADEVWAVCQAAELGRASVRRRPQLRRVRRARNGPLLRRPTRRNHPRRLHRQSARGVHRMGRTRRTRRQDAAARRACTPTSTRRSDASG